MSKNEFKYFNFIKPYKIKVIIIVIMYLITLLCSVSIPYLLGNVIEMLEKNMYTSIYLIKAFVLVLGLYFIWNLINALVSVKFSFINKSIENDIRVFFYDKLFKCKISTYNKLKDGEILNRISRDTEKLENAFTNLFYLIISLIYCIMLIIFMVNINVLLSAVILILFTFIVIIQKLLSNPLGKLYKNYKKTEDDIFSDIKNNMAGFMNIKIFNMSENILRIFKESNFKSLNSYLEVSKRVSLIKNLNFFLAAIFKISPIFLGAILYSKKMITIGSIFALYSYAIQIASEVRSIIEADIVLKDIKTSYERIQEVITLLDDYDETEITFDENIDNIVLKETNFCYDDRFILYNITNKFYKGDIVSLTGENGAGKSTFIQIICGILKANGVFYNETNQQLLNENVLLNQISYMVQDGYLFPSTIMDNLTCFNKKLEPKAKELCKNLGIDHKISNLKNGYYTFVNDKNSNLSGGEKQLISLARTLLKDSSILILDEPNSALDSNIEEILNTKLKHYLQNKIVFIISHKGSLKLLCNRHIHLKDGILTTFDENCS